MIDSRLTVLIQSVVREVLDNVPPSMRLRFERDQDELFNVAFLGVVELSAKNEAAERRAAAAAVRDFMKQSTIAHLSLSDPGVYAQAERIPDPRA